MLVVTYRTHAGNYGSKLIHRGGIVAVSPMEKESQMKHGAHMWMCGVMVAFALIVLVVSGNPAALAPALMCVVMMVVMMSMMGGHGGGSNDKPGGG